VLSAILSFVASHSNIVIWFHGAI